MTAIDDDDLSEIDRKALKTCMRLASRDRERAAQLKSQLAGSKFCEAQPWFDVARFAASIVQTRSLGLRPWERAPCNVSEDDLSDDPQVRKAQSLLRKMLAGGLSRFDPDPMRVLIDD
jgi:hypothetical protein